MTRRRLFALVAAVVGLKTASKQQFYTGSIWVKSGTEEPLYHYVFSGPDIHVVAGSLRDTLARWRAGTAVLDTHGQEVP